MSSPAATALARPLLHTAHVVTFFVLLASGLLLILPELRESLTGGYALQLHHTHCWAGVASIVLPGAVLARFGLASLRPADAERSPRTLLKAVHVAFTILLALAFAATGAILWPRTPIDENLADLSRTLHRDLTWTVMGLVALHLVEVGISAVLERVRAATEASK